MEEIREFDAVKRYSELRKTMNMSDAIIQLQVDILDADYKKHQHQLTEETNDELGKEIAKLRDVIWDKVGKEHQSGMIASPEYVVLLAKDLLSKLTEEVTDKEVENFIQSLPWDYKDTANSGFGLEDAKCLVGGNIRNFWQWIKNKQFKLTEETEEGFREYLNIVFFEKHNYEINSIFNRIFTHYKLIKREQ